MWHQLWCSVCGGYHAICFESHIQVAESITHHIQKQLDILEHTSQQATLNPPSSQLCHAFVKVSPQPNTVLFKKCLHHRFGIKTCRRESSVGKLCPDSHTRLRWRKPDTRERCWGQDTEYCMIKGLTSLPSPHIVDSTFTHTAKNFSVISQCIYLYIFKWVYVIISILHFWFLICNPYSELTV